MSTKKSTPPPKPKLLRGALWVEESPADAWPPSTTMVARGLYTDGTPYMVFATFNTKTIHLYSPALNIVRRVSLSSLMEAMNTAKPAPKARARKRGK